MRIYACYLYAYIRHTCIYALEHFILNIFCVNRHIYFISLFCNVPIWLFCNVYVVADNEVTVVGRAHCNAMPSLATGFFAICIISNSARYATTILQVL